MYPHRNTSHNEQALMGNVFGVSEVGANTSHKINLRLISVKIRNIVGEIPIRHVVVFVKKSFRAEIFHQRSRILISICRAHPFHQPTESTHQRENISKQYNTKTPDTSQGGGGLAAGAKPIKSCAAPLWCGQQC